MTTISWHTDVISKSGHWDTISWTNPLIVQLTSQLVSVLF